MSTNQIDPQRLARGMSIEIQRRNRVEYDRRLNNRRGPSVVLIVAGIVLFAVVLLLMGCSDGRHKAQATPRQPRTEARTPAGTIVHAHGDTIIILWPTATPEAAR